MKRILCCITTLCILLCSVFLSSCGNNSSIQNTTEQPSTSKTQGNLENSNSKAESKTTSSQMSSDTSANSITGSLLAENFVKDGQFIKYTQNGENIGLQGIDVSDYNGEINWQLVKEDGIDFAIIRLGGRGYGDSGVLYKDESALSYIKGAKSAGLKVGGYIFSQAISEEEAKQEADYAVSVLNGESLDFPIAFDWETIEEDTARTDFLDNDTLTKCAKAFCEEITAKGYKPIIYAKPEVFSRYNKTELTERDFWYAEYADVPTELQGFSMWQYSETAVINGIDGTTDLNLCFEY